VSLEDILPEMTVNITIVWTVGHEGVKLNDMADHLAKVLHLTFRQGLFWLRISSRTMTLLKLQVILLQNHGKKWNQDVSGFYTQSLISSVGRKVFSPQNRDIGIAHCRLLLHHTMLRDDAQ